MKRYLIFAMFVVLAIALISPFSVSAKTKAGVKSGSFFYFFDKAFERADLFFTFSSEKKAKKILEHGEERLAEAEESASENKPEAAKTAMENYHKNIEVLEKVLEKVPEEAKEAIEKAIETSKERQEEAMKETEELEKEVSEIEPEVEEAESELKEKENEEKAEIKDDKKEENKKEIEKLKKEVESLKQKQPQVKIIEKIEKIIEKPVVIEKTQSSSSQIKQNENIVTLPNGAVVEMDANGNVVRTIKEMPQTSNTALSSALKQIVTPSTFLIPSSIKISTNKLNNYMEIALNPQIEHNERIDIIATVKDISGNPMSNQTVIFENGYSSAKSITDSGGIADVCFIADSGGFVGGQVVYGQTSIIAKVLIPTNSTFIQDKILVNAPIDQNLKNLDRRQQGHLYEFRCQ